MSIKKIEIFVNKSLICRQQTLIIAIYYINILIMNTTYGMFLKIIINKEI